MDICCRLKTRVENALLEQKIRFYQYRYDENRLGQMFCLLQMNGRSAGYAGARKARLVDYKNKAVFDVSSIMRELHRYEVVSFDVFDTLVMRSVRHPTDVFRKIEEQYCVPGFAQYRIAAEKMARQKKYAQCRTTEASIEDIYRIMGQINDYDKVSADEEFEVEVSCCKADSMMQRLVEQLLAERKRVIAVSDMYLHKKQISQLLCGCGYEGLQEIYVSCDYRAGKSDGKLFPIVQKRIGADKKLVHIGDNFYSDVYRQKHSNMGTLHYINDKR